MRLDLTEQSSGVRQESESRIQSDADNHVAERQRCRQRETADQINAVFCIRRLAAQRVQSQTTCAFAIKWVIGDPDESDDAHAEKRKRAECNLSIGVWIYAKRLDVEWDKLKQ